MPEPAQCFARGTVVVPSRHNVPGRVRTSGPGPEGEKSRLVIRRRKVRLPHLWTSHTHTHPFIPIHTHSNTHNTDFREPAFRNPDERDERGAMGTQGPEVR